jgi:hypothetical protein
MSGAPMYIPVPTVTVPQPQHPPVPPAPKGLDAPQLNSYVNAFSPPPQPNGPPQQPMMNPQQMMMMQQQMLAQQQMYAQQQFAAQYGYGPRPPMMNPYMPQQPPMSQGPMANGSRQYMGPQPPNPFGYQAAQMPYPPMQPTMQPVQYQQPPMPAPQPPSPQQVDQLIKAMRESPYPAQREWSAQLLTGFDWRAQPQIVPALIQSATQDPAPTVRAGCVYCLGRMNAAIEPVFAMLQGMRTDIDPRVRTEVERAYTRLSQN